ncbi:hypothetical protein D9M68_19510 [compost metagenome]
MNISRLIQLLDTIPEAAMRKPALETAIAVELGYAFDLPGGKVESIIAHFEQFHAEPAKRVIAELNEMYPFSINVVYNMVVDVYKNRYTIAYEPRLLSVEDICGHLARPAFKASVDPVHANVLVLGMGGLLRSELTDFVRRFVV